MWGNATTMPGKKSSNPQLDIRIGTLVNGMQRDVAGYIRAILPHGFECLQLTFNAGVVDLDLKKLAASVKAAIGDADVVISALGIYANPLESGEDDRKAALGWRKLIDAAHLFGAGLVSGFTGRLRGQPIDQSIPRFKQVFGPLARRAADKGLKLAFENCDMGGDWASGDFNIAHNPTAWEMMFDAVPGDTLGLEWEPCHQMVRLIDPLPQLRKWVGRIYHLHGKDATVMWDVVREYGVDGPRPFAFHRTPGFGDSNWTDIISELRRAGYRGTIDIEGWHDPVWRGELEMTGQVHALNYLKHCRGGAFVPNPPV